MNIDVGTATGEEKRGLKKEVYYTHRFQRRDQ
jgi:hypothetical protein